MKPNKQLGIGILITLFAFLAIAAFPPEWNSGQFQSIGGFFSHLNGGNLGTNMIAHELFVVTNASASTATLKLMGSDGDAGETIDFYNHSNSKRFSFFYAAGVGDSLFFRNNADADLLSIAQSGTITATATTGNDIRGHERFQFDNRATTTVDNTTSETTLTNATASGYPQIAAAYLTEGTRILVEGAGATSNMESGETVTFRSRLSGTLISSVAITSGGNGRWRATFIITVRTTGAAGAFVSDDTVYDASNGMFALGTTTSAIDTTTAKVFDMTVQMDQASDTVTCDTLVVTILRP